MTARFRRSFVLVVLLGAVALVASSCTSTTQNAATVEYTDTTGSHTVNITNADFQSELRDLVGNPEFQKLVATSNFTGDGSNSTDPQIAAIYLNQVINQVPIDAEFDELHLTVTDAIHQQAQQQAKQQFALRSEVDAQGNFKGPGVVFNAFPKSFQTLLVDRVARQIALGQYYSNATPDKVRAFYDEYKDQMCPTGRVVSHILVKDQATAEAILAQLGAGASFAQLAKQKSTDTNSGKVGGNLGCLTKGAFVPGFEAAALAAPFGTPVGPVKTQFGYHVILVEKPTFDNLASSFASAMQQGKSIDLRERAMKVRIDDPRLGTAALTRSAQSGLEHWVVTPPVVPNPSNDRGGSAATTTTTNPLTGG